MITELVDTLKREKRLDASGYRSLLECCNADEISYLHSSAQETAIGRFGHRIYIRGLIEITNICRNDCLYCGIRKSNRNISRYWLSTDEVLARCSFGYERGFRTFVLQGGEMPDDADSYIEDLCRRIRAGFPDCAITLSLGERREESYRRFFEAGATRYLLRHETHNASHYSRLHPAEMSLDKRLHCLETLKSTGYQTGTGIMVGSPYQTMDNIVEDIVYIGRLQPEMIGLGPFIPHKDTVFSGWYSEHQPSANAEGMDNYSGRTDLYDRRIDLTMKLISIFRFMFPDALIPSTTALATISADGREKGILAGANVLMPNLSPENIRGDYSLYDGKASSGAESAEGLDALKTRIERIGYHIVTDKGDYNRK